MDLQSLSFHLCSEVSMFELHIYMMYFAVKHGSESATREQAKTDGSDGEECWFLHREAEAE